MNISEFGLRLDSELRKLSSVEAAVIREEVLAHLDASIQARLELGESPEEAERLAVAAFGDLTKIVPELPVVKSKRIDLKFAFSVIGVIGVGFISGRQITLPDCFGVSIAAAFGWFIISSTIARKFQWETLSCATLGLIVLCGIGRSFSHATLQPLSLVDTGDRWQMQHSIEAFKLQDDHFANTVPDLIEQNNRFQRGESDLTPGKVARFGESGLVLLKHTSDREKAKHEWDTAMTVIPRIVDRQTRDRFQGRLLLEEALRRPWWFSIPSQCVASWSESGVSSFVTYSVPVHLAAFGLGTMWRRRRRLPDSGVSA